MSLYSRKRGRESERKREGNIGKAEERGEGPPEGYIIIPPSWTKKKVRSNEQVPT